MAGWRHQLNGHAFEQTQEDGEGQGSLVCCGPQVRKESGTTKQLNNNISNLKLLKQISLFYPFPIKK